MADATVLVVDDDAGIRSALRRGLSLAGYDVVTAADGLEALEMVASEAPDVIVLDIGLPGLDGVQVTRRLREDGRDVPICILSARAEVDDRVAGLQAGADDYVVKPFEIKEIAARLEALLRRAHATAADAEQVVRVADLTVDLAGRRVQRGDRDIDLTRREFELLETLARNSDIVLSRDRLLELVWGYDFAVDTNVVDVFVGYLRRKTEADGETRLIQTVRGVGFVLRAP